ncbi:hypothetical protein CN1A_10 [Clavibacter phage CN1A]|uniref:Uncharacterized protein n=1 Tax=Clavibacter phage CN1A TaxID=1406793 RepID=U5PTB9_9CAUD|nr:hypothetical protein CN1A_10 [Clavibacter phage CN1A]AGY47119.1 hypothetical protein CN1A_10 [Clavibacter phage CN1A]
MTTQQPTRYYKAVRPDGTDFYSGKVNYLAGDTIKHPSPGDVGSSGAFGYLSISVSPTDCTGFTWPARLLEVEPIGESWTPHAGDLPNKRAAHEIRVLRELPAYELLGPQGAEFAALLERFTTLTADDCDKLAAARAAARSDAWGAARDAARDAAWGAARPAAWDAAWDAVLPAARAVARAAARPDAWDAAWAVVREVAWALFARDLLDTEQYDLLTGPWRRSIGPIHPDDADLS